MPKLRGSLQGGSETEAGGKRSLAGRTREQNITTGYNRCPVVQQASELGSRREFNFELRYKEKKMTSLKTWQSPHEHSRYALKKVESLLDSNDNREVQKVFLDNRQIIRVLCYDKNGYPLVYSGGKWIAPLVPVSPQVGTWT